MGMWKREKERKTQHFNRPSGTLSKKLLTVTICYIRKSWRRIKKKDQPMESFTWDCYSFSQAAKHFNKLGKWDCKTTTSDSKPQGQEPFLKLILTQVLTLIRFQEENVPLSSFSVLGEAVVSYVDSEKQFSSQCVALTGTSGPFCHSFLYSPRDALPRHPLISSLFSYARGYFPQKWHCSCIKASSEMVPMQPLKDPNHWTALLKALGQFRTAEARIQQDLPVSSKGSESAVPASSSQAHESHCALADTRISTDRTGIFTARLN